MRVGVLAVQGAFVEHEVAITQAAAKLGLHVEVVEARTRAQAETLDAIILPGGESTTISRLLRSTGIEEIIKRRAGKDLAVLGTCAGMILLSADANHDVESKGITLLGLLDATVDRNAFGRQRDSFEMELDVIGLGPTHGVFIRAPSLESVRGDTEVICEARGKIVGARRGKVVGIAFHPELTDDTRFHEWFLQIAQS